MLTLLLACTRTTEPIEPVVPPEPPLTPQPAEKPPAQVTQSASPVGAWSSKSCGARGYERMVHLQEGGRFAGEERISPCPPEVPCVWSGVNTFSGQWSLTEQTITLTVENTDAEGETAAGWPASLTYSGGRVLEDECVYGPTKPPQTPQ